MQARILPVDSFLKDLASYKCYMYPRPRIGMNLKHCELIVALTIGDLINFISKVCPLTRKEKTINLLVNSIV